MTYAVPSLLPLPLRGTSVRASIKTWSRVNAERRALRRLDPHLLRDVGLSEAQADAEARRWFWDV